MKWALILSLLYFKAVFAQHNHDMEDTPLPPFNSTGEEPMSYALLPENKGYFYTHVIMMVLGFWIFMPMGKKNTSIHLYQKKGPSY